ncbi:MAG: tetratricopeptide repeat protein [Bacteroidota bacterium]
MISSNLFRRTARFGLVALLPLAMAWTSCSNTKDTLITRTFHNLSAHYNGYYNAGLKLEEAQDKLAESHPDHYDRILTVFQYADATKAKAVYPQLEDAMKRTRTVIERHTIIDKRGNEKPDSEKWIDDNHLLYGKCQFFKHDYFEAIETFKYVESTYRKEAGRHLGSLWLAKTYLELTQLREAEEKLDFVRNQGDFPKNSKWELEATNADFYLQTKNYDKAIEHLTRAAALVKKRDTKIRWLFILAQLHQQKGNFSQAFDLYTKVIKMNPKYEVGFNARLNRARCSDGTSGNNLTVRKELEKMKTDPKNKDYLDQIYYALAGLEKNEGNEAGQIENLNLSIRSSMANVNQKALSYLELGKIAFAKREYRSAQAYYDSTTSTLTNDYPDYTEILNRRNSLTKLVKNLKVIENEDSLQTLARLSPEERQRMVDQVLVNEAAERKRIEEERQANRIFQQSDPKKINQMNRETGSSWYFYNIQSVDLGMNEFVKKFGDRKLEDNWRRSNKQTTGIVEENPELEQIEETSKEDTLGAVASAEKRKSDMLKSIPADADAIEKSTTKIIEAYYNVGLIYREQLNDPAAAAEAFETLIKRFPESKYKLQCYYQLYRIYAGSFGSNSVSGATAINKERSEYFKNIILSQYGDTEYAEIIRNPNYALEKANRKTELELFYEETYRKYLNGEYQAVIQRKAQADSQFPKSILTPQFELLKALAIGKTQPLPTFEASLQEVIRNNSEHPVKDRAQEILDAIHAKGNVTMPQPTGPVTDPKPVDVAISAFDYKPDTTHFVVVIFQNIGGALDPVRFKTKLSNYNSANFASKAIEVQDLLFGPRNKIFILRSFKNKAEALSYNTTLFDNDDVYGSVSTDEYHQYVISSNNLAALISQAKVDEYEDFYRNFYK